VVAVGMRWRLRFAVVMLRDVAMVAGAAVHRTGRPGGASVRHEQEGDCEQAHPGAEDSRVARFCAGLAFAMMNRPIHEVSDAYNDKPIDMFEW